jgi:hypothetical protein
MNRELQPAGCVSRPIFRDVRAVNYRGIGSRFRDTQHSCALREELVRNSARSDRAASIRACQKCLTVARLALEKAAIRRMPISTTIAVQTERGETTRDLTECFP